MARLLIGNFKGIKGEKGDDGVIDSNSIISFEDYTNSTPPPTDMTLGSIKTGKSISSLLSNIKALLMSTLTTSKLANNLSTNQEGFALDARMGKQLGDSVGEINERLTTSYNNFPSPYFNGALVAYKSGGIKIIRIPQQLNTNMTVNTEYTILTLPVEFRPIQAFYKTVFIGSTNSTVITLSILQTGEVVITPRVAINSGAWFNIYEAYI